MLILMDYRRFRGPMARLSLSCYCHCLAYCHATVMLLSSTVIYCRYCYYGEPLPAVSTGRHYFKIIW